MQRQVAERKFNLKPFKCLKCHKEFPNYKFIIMKNKEVVCYNCLTASKTNIQNIRQPYKQFYYDIISKLPLPDYKIAKSCLKSIENLKQKVIDHTNKIKNKIQSFQNDLSNFFTQTLVICTSYIDKIQKIQQSDLEGWHKNPPKMLDQQKYLMNIKQKQLIACKIEQSLKQLFVNMPNIDSIIAQTQKHTQKLVCKNVSINTAINIRGLLYLGTNDGKILYEHDFQIKEIQAHTQLIRALAFDGQFKLFSGSDDLTIKIWNVKGQEPKLISTFGHLEGIKSFHRQLTLFQHGKCLASSRGQYDEYRIRLWNLKTLKNYKTLDGHTGYIRGMILNKNENLISVAEDRYLKIWDLNTCQTIRQYFHNSKIYSIFLNSEKGIICFVDDTNKVYLMDQDSLTVINAVNIGKKIYLASGLTYIYVHVDRLLFIYDWNLNLSQKMELPLNWISTTILQMGLKLIITDGYGNIHEFYPESLKPK